MAIDSKNWANPHHQTFAFTSAAAAVAVTETFGFDPTWVMYVEDTAAGNPDIWFATGSDTTNCFQMQGSDGVVSVVVVASGIDISGNTLVVGTGAQQNDGTNFGIAFR